MPTLQQGAQATHQDFILPTILQGANFKIKESVPEDSVLLLAEKP